MKRICYLTDSLSWIQAQRAKDLQPYLPEYALIPMLPTDALRYAPIILAYYDAVWFASWRIILAEPRLMDALNLSACMASVTSHYHIGGGLKPETCFRKGTDPDQEFTKAIEVLTRFRLVTCNSKILYDLLSPHLPELVLAQNGVDAEFFHPSAEGHHWFDRRVIFPSVGWVGKDKGAKNLAIFMEAYRKIDGPWPLFPMVVPKKRGGPVKTRGGMRNFYWQTDFLACTSWHEGTPNPALEAAACGLPIITTRVGNMPEFVTEGGTGWFIEPTAESLIACIERLKEITPEQYRRMSQAIRTEIEMHWTWSKRAVAYRKALETL